MSARARHDASLDALTGAYLRGPGLDLLSHDIERAKRNRQPLILAFIDVDHLKAINDSGGHTAGDQLLADMASAFRARLRSYDLLMRYGGDEFLCAIAGVTMAAAQERIVMVKDTLAERAPQGSVTVGFAELQPEDSLEDLVARADAALYRERDKDRGARP